MSRLLEETQACAKQAAGGRVSGMREGQDSTSSGDLGLLLSSLQLIIIPEDEPINSMTFYHYANRFYIAPLRLLMQTDCLEYGKKKGQCSPQILMKEHCQSLNQMPINSPA